MKHTYKTGGYGENAIVKLEVIKETDKQITTIERGYDGKPHERRQAKRSEYINFFDTFEQAKAFLLAGCDCQIRKYQSMIDSAKARKQKYNELREG